MGSSNDAINLKHFHIHGTGFPRLLVLTFPISPQHDHSLLFEPVCGKAKAA